MGWRIRSAASALPRARWDPSPSPAVHELRQREFEFRMTGNLARAAGGFSADATIATELRQPRTVTEKRP
jgi:hypothetical protein